MDKFRRKILITGLVSILGAVIITISDLLLAAQPISGAESAALSPGRLIEIEQWRIPVGAFLGGSAVPLMLVGVGQVFQGLKKAGKWWSWPSVLFHGHTLVLIGAYHASFAYISTIMRWAVENPNVDLTSLIALFESYREIFFYIIMIDLIIGCSWFMFAVFTNKTEYPRWFGFFNIAYITGIWLITTPFLPAPIGGFLYPIYINAASIIFFTLSTIILYYKKEWFVKSEPQNNKIVTGILILISISILIVILVLIL